MNTCRSTFLCVALLLLAGCAQPQRPFMGPYSGTLPPESRRAVNFHYNRADCAFASNLRDACRRCGSVEFRILKGTETFCRRLGREQLEDALMAIRRVDIWYARATPENVAVGVGNLPQIRFCDAEGKQIFAVLLYPAGEGYAHNGKEYVSLWRIFDSHLQPSLLAP